MVSTIGSSSAAQSYFLQALQSKYAQIDSDSDGSVTLAEFQADAPQGLSSTQQEALFSALDANGDGSLSQDEFASGLSSNRPPPPPHLSGGNAQQLAELFQGTDTDGDGSLTLDEFIAGAKGGDSSNGTSTLEDLFAKADTNGDSVLSADEFSSALSKGPGGAGGPPPGGPPPSGSGDSASATSSTSKEEDLITQILDEYLNNTQNADESTKSSALDDSVKKLLDVFDQNKDGSLTQDEAFTGLNALRNATLNYLISLQSQQQQTAA